MEKHATIKLYLKLLSLKYRDKIGLKIDFTVLKLLLL